MINQPAGFCAICACDIVHGESVRMQPLGKGDALVRVCEGCDVGVVVAQFGPERGYESGGSFLGIAGAKSPACRVPWSNSGSLAKERTAGAEFVRVLRRDEDGKPRDANAAFEVMRKRFPVGTIRSLGCVGRYFMFEHFVEQPVTPTLSEIVEPLTKYERRAKYAKSRREKLAAQKLCINGADHGPATHGILCKACRKQHRKAA